MSDQKMNPEWKRKWVEALRSGEYEQGARRLNRDGKFCCLGVLTDLCIKEGAVVGAWGREDPDGDGVPYLAPGGYEEVVCTPEGVQWVADVGANPWVRGRFLASLNDGGATFAEIADLIEEQL